VLTILLLHSTRVILPPLKLGYRIGADEPFPVGIGSRLSATWIEINRGITMYKLLLFVASVTVAGGILLAPLVASQARADHFKKKGFNVCMEQAKADPKFRANFCQKHS
jgi:hypothetical protein